METNIKPNIDIGEPLKNISHFQQLVEKLIYLTVIRPKLSFVISQISQFMHASRTPYLHAINRILRYLKGTPRKEISMRKIVLSTNNMCGYSDADWVGIFDRKLITDFCTFIDENLAT
jgi:hypothetical protein